MKKGTRTELLLSIGLTDLDMQILRSAAGDGYALQEIPADHLPLADELATMSPSVIWITQDVWSGLTSRQQGLLADVRDCSLVLVLESEANTLGHDNMLDQGFLTAVARPLDSERIREVLHRAQEVTELYADIFRMTKEIFLERELLSQKTDQLMFLNRILTRAAESLEPDDILSKAREDMGLLFPVDTLQAAFWNTDEQHIEPELFVDAEIQSPERTAWVEVLLENAGRLSGQSIKGYSVETLPRTASRKGKGREISAPDPDMLAVFPLRSGKEMFGCLLLSTTEQVSIGKESLQTIRAAINHLALALKNSLLYKNAKNRAEFDGLTRIHNRQSFDERLFVELKRHQRHRMDMTLLLLDLDHFKKINDTYGHLAGDMVLREVGAIISNSIRVSDFSARYGGEEFVVLLPQTSEEQAWLLAERLRQSVEDTDFNFRGDDFQITASIGIASLTPGSLDAANDLLGKADAALYAAKENGRNMVWLSSRPERRVTMEQ